VNKDTVAVIQPGRGFPGENIQFLDSRTGRVKRSSSLGSLLSGPLAVPKDGSYILCRLRNIATVVSVATGEVLTSFRRLTNPVSSLVWVPSFQGETIARGYALLDAAFQGHLWSAESGSIKSTWGGLPYSVHAVASDGFGNRLLLGCSEGKVRLFDATTGKELLVREAGDRFNTVVSVGFALGGKLMWGAGRRGSLRVWSVSSGELAAEIATDPMGDSTVAVAPAGDVISISQGSTLRLVDIATLEPVGELEIPQKAVYGSTFSQDSRYLVLGGIGASASLIDVRSQKILRQFDTKGRTVTAAAFGSDSTEAWIALSDGTLEVWETATGIRKRAIRTGGIATTLAHRPGSTLVAIGYQSGVINFVDTQEHRVVGSAISFLGDQWVTVSASQQFDSRSLENDLPAHWSADDDPLRPLPPEIFMRDYYEPRLLPRLLAGDPKLKKPVRSLASLNRTQPEVGKPELVPEAGNSGLVTVRVRVKSQVSDIQKDGRGRFRQSGVYDLRLFRDGQLVGQWPSLGDRAEPAAGAEDSDAEREAWKKRHLVLETGERVIEFPHVRLPRRADQREAVWTAYAFNEDRVKSATATNTVPLPAGLGVRKGKAYLITVGVNKTQSAPPAWDLDYAVNDARDVSRVVAQKLNDTKQFATNAVQVRLISDRAALQAGELPATQAQLKAVLDVLAGRKVAEPMRARLEKLGLNEAAQPEDLVLLSISSHGYTDEKGTFHFVLGDVKEPQKVTPALDRSTLTSEQLSAWLRQVDAGELVLIVDACQSEATVNSEGFKPGPMGSRGLGQLAYDKGMRVLAASKAKESAFERAGLRHGLLSYALIQRGLEEGGADWKPRDEKITIGEWLLFAEQEVPKLFTEGEAKGGVQRRSAPDGTRDSYQGSKKTPQRYQQPTLFDFQRSKRETFLNRMI
jgi:WD40 repeat protein